MNTIFTCFRSGAILLVVAVYTSWLGTAYGVSVDNFEARWFTNAQGVVPYRLFIPTNYTSAGRFPLVLFLHGAGESGSDNWYQLVGQTGPLVFASETNQLEHPSFMVAPQCPSGSSWTDASLRLRVFGMINALKSEFTVDTNRLRLGGLPDRRHPTSDGAANRPSRVLPHPRAMSGGNFSASAVCHVESRQPACLRTKAMKISEGKRRLTAHG